MEFKKPEIKMEEIPGAKMEVELFELPNQFIRLEKGAKGEYVWFRNWADGKEEPAYLLLKSRVAGRAVVEGEECWEVKVEVRDPRGKLRSTQLLFCDRREDGFYYLASISMGKGRSTEVYFSPDPARIFPFHLHLGMRSSAFGKEMEVERIVNLQINGRSVKAIEVIYPATSLGDTLRLNRTFIGEDGRLVLFERYHSFTGEPSGPLADAPVIEYKGRKYLLFHYAVPKWILL